ncbi:MAG: hypothetical protein P4L11_13740 [Geothrix sp.]|nr:hypothetical protein [Geothrix sp.]
MPVMLPGPSIGMRLFTLKVACSASTNFSIFEIQYRDLCNPINHVFATYAKVPDSLLYTSGPGSTLVPLPGSWIYVDGTDIYLQLIQGYAGSVITMINLYKLTGIDPTTKIGTFVLISTNSTPGVSPNFSYGIPGDGGYTPFGETTANYSISYSAGNLDGTNVTTLLTQTDYNGTHTLGDTQTINGAVLLLTPYYPSGGGIKLTVTETYRHRIIEATGYYVLNNVRPFGGSITYSIGGGIAVTEEGGSTEWNWPAQPVLNGALWELATLTACLPVALTCGGEFGVFFGNRTTYSGYNAHTGASGTATNVFMCQSNLGNVMAYTGVTSRSSGAELLAGIWGANAEAQVWSAYQRGPAYTYASKGLGTAYDYNDHYVVKGSDTAFANKYSIFSYLDESDGSVIWVKGVEDPKPELWRDNVKLYDMNGRRSQGQLWPRTRLGMCQARPEKGQLWPRTR